MTISVNGTPAPQPQNNPQGLNPQQQKLVELGIPKDVVLQGDEAIKKFAEANGIQLPAKADPASAAASTSALKPKADIKEDKVEITKKEPTEADQLKREGEKTRKKVNEEFVKDAKDYSQKDAAFRAKQEEVNQLRAKFNQVSKKTMKKEIEVEDANGNKTKVDKFKAREEAQAALEKAENELVALRKEREAAKAKLEGKKQLSAANQYNVDNADGAAAKKQAARTDVDDYLTSDEGRKAVKDNLITTADGTPLVDKDGKPFKRGSAERAKAYDAIQEEYEKSGNPISRKGARRIYKARTKDFSSMEKEDALEKIIIGDKDAYKAATKKAGFDKDMPSVTYMSEDLYAKAQKFAKSRGVELPTLEDAKKNGLTGAQLEQFQQLLMDEAGDVGSRLDAKERKALDKDFKDISYGDFRKMFTAGNVDVQKTYNTAAAVAGAAASIGTGAILGIPNPGTAGVEDIVVDIPTYVGGEHTGHFETIQEIIPGTPGSGRSLNWKNIGISAGVGAAVAMGIKAIANYDPNGFHKGVTLEQYVYNELDKDAAFKKLAPNVKATMAKIIAENKDKSKDEIYAACDRALGDANERINLRESVGADASLRALRQRQKQEIPQDEVMPELQQRKIYDIGGGKFVDEQGNEVDMSDADYIKEGAVTDNKAKAVGSRATAYDEKVVHTKHKNNTDFNREDTKATTDYESGDIANKNHTGTWQQVRSQYVTANNQGEVEVRMGNSKDPKAPDGLVLKDDTNGTANTYEYAKLTSAEIAELKLDPAKGPYYKVVSAIDGDNGKEITQAKGKVFRLSVDENDRGSTYQSTTSDGYLESRTKSDISQLNYHMDAVTQEGTSSAVFVKVFKNK